MNYFLIILSFLLFTNCSLTSSKLATQEYGINNIETSVFTAINYVLTTFSTTTN